MSRVILASGSPRRRELLSKAGIVYTVQVSHEEEHYTKTIPAEIVMELASQKAEHIAALQQDRSEELVIVGADTVVAVDDRILGKPADQAEAKEMIVSIRGRKHQVYTGVCLIRLTPDESGRFFKETLKKTFYDVSHVYVKPMTDDEVRAYVAFGESMDAAGAYKIQGQFGHFIDHIEGNYYNIMGLPVERTAQEILELTEEQ